MKKGLFIIHIFCTFVKIRTVLQPARPKDGFPTLFLKMIAAVAAGRTAGKLLKDFGKISDIVKAQLLADFGDGSRTVF